MTDWSQQPWDFSQTFSEFIAQQASLGMLPGAAVPCFGQPASAASQQAQLPLLAPAAPLPADLRQWQLWMQQQQPAQLAAQLGGGGKRRRAGQEAAAAHTGWQQEAPGRASALG